MHDAGMEIAAKLASKHRRSRMRRMATGQRIEIQPRDLEIFRLLGRYRYLRSTYIHAFVGGDKTRLIERLGKLYHEGGYLNRPAEQWEMLDARNRPAIYENTRKSLEILPAEGLDIENSLCPIAGGGEQRQFRHALMISDILASVEIAARDIPGLRFISCAEILARAPAATLTQASPLRLPVFIAHEFAGGQREQMLLRLIPDGLFGFEYGVGASKSYRFFALEADRGTMPAARETLQRTSCLRKMLAYREVLSGKLYKTRLGIPNLIVLTATISKPHMDTIMEVAKTISGDGLSRAFLFKTLPCSVEPMEDVLSVPWRCSGGKVLDIAQP
jgi:Replication-relaxation